MRNGAGNRDSESVDFLTGRKNWFAISCLLGLAGLILGWWLLIGLLPASRKWFWPEAWPTAGLLSFWLPDLLLVAIGSIVGAEACWQRRGSAGPILWLTAGGMLYASLYCLAVSLSTGSAWLATATMLPAGMILFGIAAWDHRRGAR